jgi:PAS domain S-box-containing protein
MTASDSELDELRAQNAALAASLRELEEMARHSQEMFEMVADGYLITDADGVITEANRSACELVGRPHGQVVGKPLATFVEAGDRGAFYTQLNRINRAGSGGHLTLNLSLRDHEIIPTSVRATHASQQSGDGLNVMWLLRDRRHDLMSEELRSSEERLRVLFDFAEVGIVLCDVDGNILFSNRYADAVLDRRRDAVARVQWLATTHPDDRSAVEAIIGAAGARGQVTSLRHRVVHHDGTAVWVDHSVAPFRETGVEGADKLTGFVSTLIDVTVERTAMVELAASHDFTEALLDSASALVIVIDRNGRVLRFNKACESVTGFTAVDVIGCQLTDKLLPPDQRAPVLDILAELASSADEEVSGRLEIEWLTAGGERRRLEWSYTTVRLRDGSPGIVGTGIDITERRLLESRLAQADRLESIGRLTAGVAHDFNNTLTTLRLRLDRLGGRDLDDASRADLTAAAGTIDRTQRLIADLLSFSSRAESTPEPIALAGEVHRALDNLTELLGDEITIELDLAVDPTVLIDPGRFEQALTNLAWNARDAMPEGGVLRISTRIETIRPLAVATVQVPSRLDPGDYVVLDVTDSGIGIEPEVLPHVFDPYFTTKPRGHGTGLGLATTYGTIVQSGGAITVDSTPGSGTTFHIWLPLATTAAAVGAIADVPAALVVDDDDDIRQVLVDELVALGYRTTEADSGSAALARLAEPVDVLICDVQLPDRSGADVATRFRERYHDLEVVYISGAAPSQLRELLPDDAAVLSKPFAISDLVAALRGRPDRPPNQP